MAANTSLIDSNCFPGVWLLLVVVVLVVVVLVVVVLVVVVLVVAGWVLQHVPPPPDWHAPSSLTLSTVSSAVVSFGRVPSTHPPPLPSAASQESTPPPPQQRPPSAMVSLPALDAVLLWRVSNSAPAAATVFQLAGVPVTVTASASVLCVVVVAGVAGAVSRKASTCAAELSSLVCGLSRCTATWPGMCVRACAVVRVCVRVRTKRTRCWDKACLLDKRSSYGY